MSVGDQEKSVMEMSNVMLYREPVQVSSSVPVLVISDPSNTRKPNGYSVSSVCR